MASAQFRMSPIRPNGSLDSFKGDYNDENSSLLNGKGQDVEAAEKLLSSGTEDKSKPAKTSLLAGALYCCASMSMVLLNKMALSSFQFHSANALLFFQCLLCIISVKICEHLKIVKLEPWNPAIVRIWIPVNMIFVGMIGTSFWALQSLNVAMVTVLKNLTNIFTIGGDYYFYGRTYNMGVWASMGLMILSALCGAFTDLSFSARGYFWQLVNCGFTAAYSLYLRGAMDRVSPYTVSGKKLDEFSMVFYNNLLSLPFIAVLMAGSGELSSVWYEPDLHNPAFLFIAILSGIIGFAISFSSLWFISTTTPTIYSLVGSLNKVPLAFIGLFAFHTPWNFQNLASIMVGLVAGVVFAYAKSRS